MPRDNAVILSLAIQTLLLPRVACHSSVAADVSAWDFDSGVFVPEEGPAAGDGGRGAPQRDGRGSMTWPDGRSFIGVWSGGCPADGEFHIPPRDAYRWGNK